MRRSRILLNLCRKSYLAGYLAFCIAVVMWPSLSSAATAREKYYQAEACYKKLRNSPKRQKYRDQWLACIEKFQKVYRHDPSGPWAAAGLYKSGELYQRLYKRSLMAADKTEALDIFERIIKRYPKSRYRSKAKHAIGQLSRKKRPKSAAKKIVSDKGRSSKSGSARDKYIRADACYKRLRNSSKKQKYRDQWLVCIEKFQAVYQHDPVGPWAAAGLYRSGELYQELYKRSSKASDKKEALAAFNHIITHYPQSRYKPKAKKAMQRYSSKAPPKIAAKSVKEDKQDFEKPIDDIAKEIAKATKTPPPVKADIPTDQKENITVKGLRFWSNPSYTRVVIDADQETTYTHRLLKKDVSIQKPQRLYVDLNNSRLGQDLKKFIPINDNLLSDVRAGQRTPRSVRVVVDIKSFKTYKIFSLKNPFRIVIDVWGKVGSPRHTLAKKGSNDTKLSPGSLAKQLALGVRRIVIDPGHGGRDYGAPGYLKGVHEKHIALKIGKRLAKKIRQKLGFEVFMTRSNDRNLTLEERTAIANTKNADLFISIHTNAARDRRAIGIETFFLNLATDDDAILVAARENATSKKNISDLQAILSDLMQNAKINESSRLAVHVQRSMSEHLRKYYSRIKSKGVKQAPFYVLLGAQMPAILIETSFISNARECKRLINPKYQDRMCDAIVKGIQAYIKEMNPTALIRPQPKSSSKG
ncbi:MAG: N-acetylmuramoyl-L-alanine amidase [Desulfobacterales bacterium]|nr:MAG: N-acetylmuramoyl-L-alanine amidase [Desulfobacterales bacterium]